MTLTEDLQDNALQKKALRALGGLPPFSPVLNQLMASLASDEVSFSKLADLIEKDAVVAGNVLHLVNSALYARRGTVNSVRHAVSLLGVNKLRNAVLGMSMTQMWNKVQTPASWSMARFNMHAAATAILSDMLAQTAPTAYPEGAFVAGLLHDVGRLLIALGLSEEHERILSLYTANQGRTLVDCETEVLGFTHPHLSAQVLLYWKLPEAICDAVGEHHGAYDATAARPDKNVTLARLVAAADQYMTSIGVSILRPEAQPAKLDNAGSALQSLGIAAGPLQTLLGEFEGELANMTPFFR